MFNRWWRRQDETDDTETRDSRDETDDTETRDSRTDNRFRYTTQVVVPIMTAIIGLFGAQQFWNFINSISPISNKDLSSLQGTWHGAYARFKRDMTQEVVTETVIFKSGRNSKLLASSKDFKGKKWLQVGYWKDGRLAFSYVSEQLSETGIGTYILSRYDKTDIYFGYWEGVSSSIKKVIRCPYILSKSAPGSDLKNKYNEKIYNMYNDYLNQDCQEVDLPKTTS